ncbi:hypothetical protein H9657_16860 [Cellulomonas sp. Sa3CUA2]|uniref:Uncharacterized protein n=1 Tax=Cellulomonas avistercoris TaxID=2762242 RepID=A0ABR8QHR4_9CELL|nr:DUF6584 family protein [Cellulomonas avistercoris]MBD7919945.1 hypothetical protein [Cellulomonas avistercoris]
MTVERTLARVDDDLRTGDVEMALTRLRSLVRSLPHRLDARERLADVLRLQGDAVEAGRWSYLAEHRDADEVAAFERACGDDPVRIMRALRWRGDEQAAATASAQQRLLDVRARAEAHAGKKLDWTSPGREVGGSRWDLAGVGCFLGGLVLVTLVAIGAATVVGWIL